MVPDRTSDDESLGGGPMCLHGIPGKPRDIIASCSGLSGLTGGIPNVIPAIKKISEAAQIRPMRGHLGRMVAQIRLVFLVSDGSQCGSPYLTFVHNLVCNADRTSG